MKMNVISVKKITALCLASFYVFIAVVFAVIWVFSTPLGLLVSAVEKLIIRKPLMVSTDFVLTDINSWLS